MSFILSKVLWPLVSPANFLAALLVIGVAALAFGRRRIGWFFLGIGTALLVVLTVVPVWAWVLTPLEARFPRPTLPEKVDGVIVLGGSVDVTVTRSWNHPTVNHAADRLVEFSWLARRYPGAKLVFTGGSGSLTNPDTVEAPVARAVLEHMGAPVERMVFEDRSRNTFENAVFTKELMQPKPGETWVLITSAYHMPRSMGIFRKIGWPVLADPVGYYSAIDDVSQYGPNLAKDLWILDDAVHEWMGLVAYRLMGRTDALFPGPG